MKINKKYIVGVTLLIIAILVGFAGFLLYKKITSPSKIHFHAGFVVFKDDRKVDFSDFKYMKVDPCTDKKGDEKPTAQELQIDKAHLHDNVGTVVHIENNNSHWSDLFFNLKYPVSNSDVKGYANGVEIKNFLNSPILPFQSVVVFIGSNNPIHLKEQVPLSYIKSKVKKSENCG